MIGDLIYNHRKWICPVTAIDKDHVIVIAQHYGESSYRWEDVNPIPLTPEILEKIGFASVHNIGYIIDDYNGTQVIYDFWNHNFRIIKDYKVRLDIDFFGDMSVHELQHALRLLEIGKEILL